MKGNNKSSYDYIYIFLKGKRRRRKHHIHLQLNQFFVQFKEIDINDITKESLSVFFFFFNII